MFSADFAAEISGSNRRSPKPRASGCSMTCRSSLTSTVLTPARSANSANVGRASSSGAIACRPVQCARQLPAKSGESAITVSHKTDRAASRLKFGVSSHVLPYGPSHPAPSRSTTKTTALRAAAAMRLVNVAHDTDDDAHDARLLHINRRHLPIGRLQSNPIGLRMPILERCFAIGRLRDDHLPRLRRFLLLYYDIVTVVDMRIDHRFALDLERAIALL